MTSQEELIKQLTWAKLFNSKGRNKTVKGAFGKPPFSYEMRSAAEVAEIIETKRRERAERRASICLL